MELYLYLAVTRSREGTEELGLGERLKNHGLSRGITTAEILQRRTNRTKGEDEDDSCREKN